MVKAGAFDDKNGGGNKTKSAATKFKKKETVNTVVEEEGDGEETQVKDNNLPTQEHLLWMLGMSTTLVGNVSDTEEPSTESKGVLG